MFTWQIAECEQYERVIVTCLVDVMREQSLQPIRIPAKCVVTTQVRPGQCQQVEQGPQQTREQQGPPPDSEQRHGNILYTPGPLERSQVLGVVAQSLQKL